MLANTGSSGALLYGNGVACPEQRRRRRRRDEFGKGLPWNQYRFRYTGQAWIEEIGLHYYKARMYSAELGRFMQADPVGYDGDGPNLYAYAICCGNGVVRRSDAQCTSCR